MSIKPTALVFDVNETLSDMAPMAQRFADIGAPRRMAPLWFTSVLRDGFALSTVGGYEQFFKLAEHTLRTILAGEALNRDMTAAIEHIVRGFMELQVHPDVPDGIRALRSAEIRLVTLSNGSAEVAETLLANAGLRGEFEAVLSVDQAGAWKPAAASYAYAAQVCGLALADMALVAVHPWDINGAAMAGMSTAWINRNSAPYPSFFSVPSYTAASLIDLAKQLST